MKTSISIFSVLLCAVVLLSCQNALGMISLANLSKEKAKEMGIVMKARKNGDAGIKVWLEFKQEGVLEAFTYGELRMNDEDGKHLLSAMLRENPVHHQQSKEITSIAFSLDPAELEKCSFWVVCYQSIQGDVGFILKVSDFLDLKIPVTER